ncbi:hypothetical protein [Bacillus vallismortis]|uniref:hypothetical protein n=1 Tax=Bacillus vallismortis TaxID=72361 RepID=UPI001F088A02|nr:hypothetical protein [Bacillus vallismortis]
MLDKFAEKGLLLSNVIAGKLPIFESDGNVILISSDKHKTVFEDIFADDDEKNSIFPIERVEYTKDILIWAKENIKYKNKRGILGREKAEERLKWIKEK